MAACCLPFSFFKCQNWRLEDESKQLSLTYSTYMYVVFYKCQIKVTTVSWVIDFFLTAQAYFDYKVKIILTGTSNNEMYYYGYLC